MTDTLVADDKAIEQTVNQKIKDYIDIRELLKKCKDQYEARIQPLVEKQNELSGWMQEFMLKTGSDSIKTKLGTCYTSTRYTASLADPQAFMDFVIHSSAWELIDRKANATAVKQYVADNGTLPPGCNLSAIRTIGVRAPTRSS